MDRVEITTVVTERPRRAVAEITTDQLVASAAALLDSGYRLALVAGHDDNDGWLRVVYLFVDGPPDQRVELRVRVARDEARIPSLWHLSFPAGRFERELRDLFGIEPVGHPLARPLIRHQHWSPDWYPMRGDRGDQPDMSVDAAPYPFADVDGPGIYEIPVGPVHAGVIEPGHFRFWVVGETIVKMKARLWFVHKGVERLFEGLELHNALELSEKISGDSAVSHSVAFVQAVEEAIGVKVSERTGELRAVLLELERLYNHVADVGALCNDAGFALANARALTLREDLLRINERVTGHRLLRGGVSVGGATLRAMPTPLELHAIRLRFDDVVELARSNTIVMDRFTGTGVLTNEQAREIGVLGVAARASGVAVDARRAHPFTKPPDSFRVASASDGDVLARFQIRCDEVHDSIEQLSWYSSRGGSLHVQAPPAQAGGPLVGTGITEGWRGSIVHRLELRDDLRIGRLKIVDPSFVTWPALAIALADTIVPDFPLVNKSFNLSYAGNDL